MPSPHQSLLCQYRYDALDRLINHAPENEAQHQRFYCKSRLATEIQGALRHSIVQHGDLLLAQQQTSGDTLDTRLLATDQQRSVLHVVSKADQQQSIDYSPYGHRHAENGLLSLLGFNGERPDPVTGHYLLGNGYRAFNPILMRFNSPDSLSPFGKGGLNPYVYCLNDPINSSDPTGHIKLLLLPKLMFSERLLAHRSVASAQSLGSSSTPHHLASTSDVDLGIPRPLSNPTSNIEPTTNVARSTSPTTANLAVNNLNTAARQPKSLVEMSLSVVVANKNKLDLTELPKPTLNQIENESSRINALSANRLNDSTLSNSTLSVESALMWIGTLGALTSTFSRNRQIRRVP